MYAIRSYYGVYEFTPVSDPGSTCIMTFTNEKMGIVITSYSIHYTKLYESSNGKNIAAQMIKGYHDLSENINNTIELIKDVENSAKEQRHGIEQISDAINNLDKQTQVNASIASDANEIALSTSKLANAVVEATNKSYNFV